MSGARHTVRSAPLVLDAAAAAARGVTWRIAALGAVAVTAFVLPLAGCYEHVTKGGIVTRESQQQYQPSVEDEGPSILNELMWGTPPKGEDPVKYYRRKNSLGIQQ